MYSRVARFVCRFAGYAQHVGPTQGSQLTELGFGEIQAVQACFADAADFLAMFSAISAHPKTDLLVQGLVAPTSMYVRESSRCLSHIEPAFAASLDELDLELLRESRHRAKLLDGRAVTEVTAELLRIAADQHEQFNGGHRGLLGPLKRALQRDMGIGLCDGHIIQTTHATIFGFGTRDLDGATARKFGYEMGAYAGSLVRALEVDPVTITRDTPELGSIEMRDIRYEELYERGALGAMGRDVGAGVTLVLSSVNLGRLVVARSLASDSLTRLRILFVIAYHAVESLRSLQDGVIARPGMDVARRHALAEAIGSGDARWIRKHRHLRNLLVHYLPDRGSSPSVESANRIDWIEAYADMALSDLVGMVERYLDDVSSVLEDGLGILGDTFRWAAIP